MVTQQTTTADEFHQQISEAEENLTEREASKQADEMHLGEPCEAEIVSVDPDPEDEDAVVEFTVDLPNYKTGTISFSEFDYEEGWLDEFLDDIDCTVADMQDAAHHRVPVTYTDWKGWVVLYGRNGEHLETTYQGESNWFQIDEDEGRPHPSNRVGRLFLLAPILGGIGFFIWGLIAPFVGVVGWCFLWYCAAAWTGMTSPRRKQIAVSE